MAQHAKPSSSEKERLSHPKGLEVLLHSLHVTKLELITTLS